MKPSPTHLGQAIQFFLLQQGLQLEDLAKCIEITPDALSNLIHGRRRFRDPLLARMAETEYFKQGGFSYGRLKALRAMDEYHFSEIILAFLEYLKGDAFTCLPESFVEELQSSLENFPRRLSKARHMFMELLVHPTSVRPTPFL